MNSTNRVEPRLKRKHEEITSFIDETLNRYVMGRSLIERQWFMSIMFDRGNQWLRYNDIEGRFKRTVSKRKIPRPVTNKYKATKNALISAITSFDPRLTYAPQTDTLEDQHTAAIASQVIKSIEFEWEWSRKEIESLNWHVLTGGVFFIGGFDPNQGAVSLQPVTGCAGIESGACTYKSTNPQETVCPVCEQKGLQSPMIPQLDEQGVQEEVPVRGGKMTLDVVSQFEMFVDASIADIHDQDTIIRVHRKTKSYIGRTYGLSQKELDELDTSSVTTQGGNALRYRTALAHFMTISEVHYTDKVDVIEVWQKPNAQWKWGFHAVRIGKRYLVLESYPYISNEGKVFSPVVYIPFERETGSFYGTTPMFSCLELQRTRNRLESLILMAAMRMGSPVWIVPDPGTQMGITGDAGLVIKYTPIANSNAAPRRDEGIPVPPSIVQLIQLIDVTMDTIVGLSEITRGQRPKNTRTSSGLEKLDEVARSRQSGLFKNWTLGLADLQLMGFEIFRLVQPDRRYARATGTGTGSWTVNQIKDADLMGGVDITPEPGGTQPRTAIERQALINTLMTGGLINMQDPRTLHQVYRMFGVAELVPEMDKDQMQVAREHDRFRKQQQIQVLPWDNHAVHTQAHRELMLTEEFEDMPQEQQQLFMQHKSEHDQILAQQQQQQQQQLAQQLQLQAAQKGNNQNG